MSAKPSFLVELKRRNVIRFAGLYLVGSWLLIQVASTMIPAFEGPPWVLRVIIMILALGFIPALIFSWIFELTPQGLKRDEDVRPEESIAPQTAQRMNRMIIAVLVIALGYFAIDKFVLAPRRATAPNKSISAAGDKSIAVLPFENLSDNKENAYFADGVQDEILTALAKVADLKVISRTSVMQYRNAAGRNLREIGERLGVAHVLEGSVQRAADKVRVNAQLIDARTDAHLWAQTYDRDLANVFAIQSEIANTIAGQLQARLSSREKSEIAEAPTTDLVAYDLYRRARELDDTFNNADAKGGLLKAITLLEEAIRRDPKFLRAYCLVCEIHTDMYWGGFDHTEQRRELARAALQRAEEIQPDAGEVHAQKGVYAYHGFRDYDRALAELELAKQRLPNESRIYNMIGAIGRRTGRWEDAQSNFRRAVELDPRNVAIINEAGSTFSGLRRQAEARQFFQRCFEISPNEPFARNIFGFGEFGETGDIAAWRKQLDLVAAQGGEPARTVAFPMVLCALFQQDRSSAEKALALIPAEGVANAFDEAAVPREFCVGRAAWVFGDHKLAQTSLAAARTIFETTTREQPDYSQAWSYLGLTDAMLGRRDDAIREGKRACEILPLSKDAWVGPIWITNLAAINSLCGDKDAAFEQLEISAKIPGGVTYGELKLGRDWNPLRGDARFDKIVASLAPKQPSGDRP